MPNRSLCNHCGPTYYATYNEETYIDYETLLKLTSRLLLGGEVIAAKGIGGYHLICDASNESGCPSARDKAAGYQTIRCYVP